jgi:hypothetical protein
MKRNILHVDSERSIDYACPLNTDGDSTSQVVVAAFLIGVLAGARRSRV